MKNVILYASNKGFTENCVLKLKNQLSSETDIFNVKQEYPENLKKYDTVILGGPIYAGKVPPKLRKYLDKYKNDILGKNIGVFITSGNTEEDYMGKNFDKEIIRKAFSKEHFGAGLNTKKLIFIEKIILKMMGKCKDYENYNDEAIKRFAKAVNSL